MINFKKNKILIISIIILIILISVFLLPFLFSTQINKNEINDQVSTVVKGTVPEDSNITEQNIEIPVTHLPTPKPLKSIYISAWVAGSAKHLARIIDLIDTTELNAVVIDVKDSTGRVSFHTDNKMINDLSASEKRISDIRKLLETLHAKNIYVIARVSVFQDPYMTKKKPEWSVKKKSDGSVWKDRKGLSFLDPANKEVWDYIVNVGQTAYSVGFDEINFDYIRYPSDGNIKDINYSISEGKTRASNIEDFFAYLSTNMKEDVNIPISADLFGLVTTSAVTDDLGLGQVLERALPHFDYIAPMVYPSHFAAGWNGYKNPALKPYEVVNFTMKKAVDRTQLMGMSPDKIRPWLQDFDMGGTYTKEMVRAQIQATNDAGLDSWMLWDPKNIYTKEALNIE